MNYVTFHVGDWCTSTELLSATERGVYMALLMRYYIEERPLMQDECKRIARPYNEYEQEALDYVLKKFFTFENGSYRHHRCDKEIEDFRAKSEKRSKAAKSRWHRDTEGKEQHKRVEKASISNAQEHASADASADDCGSAFEMPSRLAVKPSSQKEERGDETAPASPTEPAETDEKPKKRSRRRPSIACPWSLDDAVPEDLAAWAKEKHPSVDFAKEFEKLIHWAQSHDERRPDWPATFRGWIARAEGYEKNRRGAYQSNRPSPLSEQDYSSYDELWGRTGIVEG